MKQLSMHACTHACELQSVPHSCPFLPCLGKVGAGEWLGPTASVTIPDSLRPSPQRPSLSILNTLKGPLQTHCTSLCFPHIHFIHTLSSWMPWQHIFKKGLEAREPKVVPKASKNATEGVFSTCFQFLPCCKLTQPLLRKHTRPVTGKPYSEFL